MAPVVATEATANKRKRDLDEHSKRKRRRQDHTPKKADITNGQPEEPTLADQPNGLEDGADHTEGMELEIAKSDVPVEKRKHKSKTRKSKAGRDGACKWSVSKPIGGRMLNIDPVLTDDEKHLILAYNTSLQVYSASDSLLLRKIQLRLARVDGRRDQIAAVCPSATSSNLLWVASYGGFVWLIDWTTGAGSDAYIPLECDRLHDMTVDSVKVGEHVRDIVYTSTRKNQTWHISAYDIRNVELEHGDRDFEIVRSRSIFSYASAIENLRVVRDGHTFAAYSGHHVILGAQTQDASPALDDVAYETITFDASDEITCLDIHVSGRVHLNVRSQKETGDEPVVDIAIGCARGTVLVYSDLLARMNLLKKPNSRSGILNRKYHWHRKAVHAVKWSRDGNYILSGGSESTLVLCQVDTQKMDFLPHLSATIENIVVSKRGSAYAIHLDDNSAIVLSTAEMKPLCYIAGIQAILSPRPISKDDSVKRIGQYSPDRLTSVPAVVSPLDSSQMLLCVGNGQQLSYSGTGPSMPLIQILDLTTMQSVSRQALTRTNPTDVNITPSGHPITEPRITGIKYSHDGRWLATTDEWQPPSRDTNSLEGASSERREAFLKFWSVSPKTEGFQLMTRIDAPHHSGQAESIFDLAADPKSDRFATIGGDGTARLWEPAIRQRDGILIKSKKGHQLHTWTCSRVISLYGNETTSDSHVTNDFRGSGAVAFSEDGSVLVCAAAHEYGTIVQVIDTESGQIRNSFNGLIHGKVQGLSVLSTNLIVLSDALMVYDLVADELRYGVQLRKPIVSNAEDDNGPGASVMTHLATDAQTGRFAVAVSRAKRKSKKIHSELAIFNSSGCEPELVQSFPNPITALMSSTGSSGFLLLDSAAQVWSVAESLDTKSLPLAQPLADLELDQGQTANGETTTNTLALLEADDGPASEDEADVDMADADDDDTVHPAVVAPQRLTELFDRAPSFAMPPIEDQFYQITKMFSAKTAIPAS
ncbi:WD40 repeat-like protein [Nemania sp. FL0916]|nr:WD40 repeat-like protein [Nemania sp. FL0916]